MKNTEPDFQRVEQLFQSAADLPGDDRIEYLDRECGPDSVLRGEVEALLAQFEQGEALTSPIARLAAHGLLPEAPIPEGPGAIIGRYKLLQVIGEGGFGVVYMAEQQRPVVRKVALKIIKLGMDTKEVVARFEAERQALALMDHPNIARVLDGGATQSGRPYFVMELVRGVAITEYCDSHDLPTHERLELFMQVCRAVQHAHQKGVIHRDIKPSNVLVTLDDGRPMPKVIDFGVAKAMHTRLTEKTLFTRFEQFVGTPAYMSPEQAEMSALDVDTRTDIYSLGVLLYELLTGTTPFDSSVLLQAGLAEIQRVIREEHPVRPSVRISTAGDAIVQRHRAIDRSALARALRGDLDWIVLKALEKERGRRYTSAHELADDVQRHLRDEPVVAGPPRATYRLRKFLARNRAAVVSAALIAVALVGGIIATSVAMVEVSRSAAHAREQTEHALVALDFLDSTLSLTNPEVALDPDITVRSLLDHTASHVSDVFAGQPWAEVRVRATIGRAYAVLGEAELAEPQLRRVIELVDALTDGAGPNPGAAEMSGGFDGMDFHTTLWTLTDVAFSLEREDSFLIAGRALRVGLDVIEADGHRDLAKAMTDFSMAVGADAWSLEPDAMREVPQLFERARREIDAGLEPGERGWIIVANQFLAAGYTVWYTTHEPLAELFWGKALEIQQQELPAHHPEIAKTVNLLVGILNTAGKAAEAEALIRGSIDSVRRVHRENTFPLALAESTLGDSISRQGRYEEAAPILLRSHETILATTKDDAHFAAVESFVRVINLYDSWGRPDEAEPYRQTLARTCAQANYAVHWSIARRTLGPEYAALVALMDRVEEHCGGISYMASPGTVQAADLEPTIEELALVRAELLDAEDVRAVTVARLLLGWANALAPQDNIEARGLIGREVLAVLRHRGEEHPADLAEALALAAEASAAAGADDQARRLAEEAALALLRAEDSGMWFATAPRVRVARVLVDQQLFEDAEAVLLPAYEILATQLGAHQPDAIWTRTLIVDMYRAWGRPDAAQRFMQDVAPGER